MKRYAIILAQDNNHDNAHSIIDTLKKTVNIESEILVYSPLNEEYLKNYIIKKATMLVDRVDPKSLEDKDKYFQFLKSMPKDQIIVFENKSAKRSV